MGALIQTKGTQKLARWLNDRFDANSIDVLRNTRTSASPLSEAFRNGDKLLKISDDFIAQNATNATTTWPADGNDILYPSATLIPTNTGNNLTKLQFSLPNATKRPDLVAIGNSVSNLTVRGNTQTGTTITGITGSVPNFSVDVSPAVKIGSANEMVSFSKGKHERLVRRWRWYLQRDLKAENNTIIREAIFAALDDKSFKRIIFQTVEDVQRVIVTTRQKLNDATEELDDEIIMSILLLTQSTTAPEKVDPQ